MDINSFWGIDVTVLVLRSKYEFCNFQETYRTQALWSFIGTTLYTSWMPDNMYSTTILKIVSKNEKWNWQVWEYKRDQSFMCVSSKSLQAFRNEVWINDCYKMAKVNTSLLIIMVLSWKVRKKKLVGLIRSTKKRNGSYEVMNA